MADDDDAPKATDLEYLWRSPVPEFYADAFRITVSPYTAYLQFSVGDPPSSGFRPVAALRMSPEHAKVMAIILKRIIRETEREAGYEIALHPTIVKENHLDLDEWRS